MWFPVPLLKLERARGTEKRGRRRTEYAHWESPTFQLDFLTSSLAGVPWLRRWEACSGRTSLHKLQAEAWADPAFCVFPEALVALFT